MKVSGSTSSLMQGVSQQTAQERGPGQHTEQVNMLPDPVQGLSRRHGTAFQSELQLTNSVATFAAMVADTANYRSYEYSNAGHDYVVLYRSAAVAAGSTLPVVQVYDRTTSTFLPLQRPVTDTQLDLLASGGISALTAIGKYVFMAGYTTPSTATTLNAWADTTNKNDAVVWVRGGTYGRLYAVDVTKTDGTQVHFEYTTPTSSYPGTLDTSTVPVYAADPAGGTQSDTEAAYITDGTGHGVTTLGWAAWSPTSLSVKKGATTLTNVSPSAPAAGQYAWAAGAPTVTFPSAYIGALDVTLTYTHTKTVSNPNYAKTVGDISNAFNTAVTNWIGTASDAIQPNAIAESLRVAAVAAGLTTATRQASTLIFDNVIAVSTSDGGDGSLMIGVANEVTSITGVSDIHKIGKIVKVRAARSAESFYLTAVSKSAGITSGYTEVTWVEGAGVKYTITGGLLYLTVSAGTAYIGSSATLMDAMIGGLNCPDYVASTVGDADSSPLPYFIGRQITYLGVFQDRLLVGAGAVLRASRTGDYLNFFRTSVLTVPADDSLEMLSQGSDDDTLRYSIIYDRDLVVFADKRQYAISGRAALTPTNANFAVMSSHANAAQLPPLAVGGRVFYGQQGETAGSVFEVQPGLVAESPESFIVSSQIDTYMAGRIIELSNNSKPTHLFARVDGERSSIFTYTYLDKAQSGRVQDAWHKQTFHGDLGPIVGMAATPDGLLLFYLRLQTNHAGAQHAYFVCDLMTLTTGLARTPYLDSQRTLTAVLGNAGGVHSTTAGDWFVAFDGTSEWQFVGTALSDQATLIAEFPSATGPRVGINQDAYFVPTNPFVRDKDNKVITSGRLTVSEISVNLAKSSGFVTVLDSISRETTDTQEFSARIVGSEDDLVGRETVTTQTQTVPIALETRDYVLKLEARTWLPFTLTSLEWTGQWFNRTQRF